MNRMATMSIAAVVVVVLVFLGVVFIVDASRDDQIADGIRIGPVDVGGLSTAAAKERVQRQLAGGARRTVVLRYRTDRFVLKPERAQERLDVDASVEAARKKGREGSNAFSRLFGGGEVDATVAPKVAYSRGAVQAFVARVADRVDRRARDADIDIRNGKLSLQKARNGVEVKRGVLVAAIVKRMTGPAVKGTLAVPVRVIEKPDKTLTDLAKRYPTVIAVNRDAKQLRLYKKLRLVHTYKIAVGQAGLETAAGRYKIQEKDVNPAWHVPNSAWAGDLAGKTIPPGDPQNPLEARWMGFHDGQGIHGTADLASLGTAASHGCIRMSVPDVKQLFRQVKIGTPMWLQ
jgi:lipoprotein-anchoring transpeptidase ErfK/SrfK